MAFEALSFWAAANTAANVADDGDRLETAMERHPRSSLSADSRGRPTQTYGSKGCGPARRSQGSSARMPDGREAAQVGDFRQDPCKSRDHARLAILAVRGAPAGRGSIRPGARAGVRCWRCWPEDASTRVPPPFWPGTGGGGVLDERFEQVSRSAISAVSYQRSTHRKMAGRKQCAYIRFPVHG